MSENNGNNKFINITGFFETKSGKGHSVKVSAEIANALANITEGDRLFLGTRDSGQPTLSYLKGETSGANERSEVSASTDEGPTSPLTPPLAQPKSTPTPTANLGGSFSNKRVSFGKPINKN